ncbi:hypothetical protein MOPEL_135_00030 [Mobilicoccus pelagius NBRC 104925]|uniref:Chloramphenicol phosphotransferase n=1 Tax=Mobilicoccus pelagius NBRC 104925 TaxID=1089455 RepID=H5UVK7_9MICO|nr:hypothetical protein MOPEL_135_00030 [Mobilicoccus pelagius NBRC 104925]
MTSDVVVFNGGSSSGKSSLTRALQGVLPGVSGRTGVVVPDEDDRQVPHRPYDPAGGGSPQPPERPQRGPQPAPPPDLLPQGEDARHEQTGDGRQRDETDGLRRTDR